VRTFLSVLKNNYYRTVPRIGPLILITVITLASTLFAVYMTGVQQVKGHVVVVSSDSSAALPKSSRLLDVTVLPEKPPYSELVKQRYDAYVTPAGNGAYQIETLRSEDYKKMILLLIGNPDARLPADQTDRGVGVNIIGFMMMFVLMLAFANLFAFADDKEQGQLSRIAASPASFGCYLAAHCAYCLSILLPEFLLLVILKQLGWNIGFTILQYAGLMAVLGFLGISFALLLNTLIRKPDNANMLGNSVTVLTSVLAGSFYSFSKNNTVLDHVIWLLPQKAVMDFAQALQNGAGWRNAGSMLYAVVFSLALFVVSYAVLRQMYVKRA
jgi:ABC-2 type transport system permease protein